MRKQNNSFFSINSEDKIEINHVIFDTASIVLLSAEILGFTLSDCCRPPAFFYISDIDVWGDSNVGGRLAGQGTGQATGQKQNC